jgi:hypothetical protein
MPAVDPQPFSLFELEQPAPSRREDELEKYMQATASQHHGTMLEAVAAMRRAIYGAATDKQGG